MCLQQPWTQLEAKISDKISDKIPVNGENEKVDETVENVDFSAENEEAVTITAEAVPVTIEDGNSESYEIDKLAEDFCNAFESAIPDTKYKDNSELIEEAVAIISAENDENMVVLDEISRKRKVMFKSHTQYQHVIAIDSPSIIFPKVEGR